MSYDVVVIGGGILGVCVARDAALRGLSVALFEQADFASGATGRMSRLLPGGLRPLETLDFTRVRQDLRERETLLQIAPHLARPLPCLIPFYGHGSSGQKLLALSRLRAGLALADALGFDKSLPTHQLLSPKDALAREPGLRPSGLSGAALVWDAHVPQVERLTLENALDARDAGARLRTHTRVDGLCWDGGRGGRRRARGVRWTDLMSGETGETAGAVVVDAGGAWTLEAEGVDAQGGGDGRRKSVSVLLPSVLGGEHGLVFPGEPAGHGEEERPLFVLPWPGGTWVGSLEVGAAPPDTARADGAEVAALLRAVSEHLPALAHAHPRLALAAPLSALAPAEPPLPSDPGGYRVIDHAANGGRDEGLLSVAGGSLTACRGIAEEAVDGVCRKLGRGLSAPPCRTAQTLLPGARGLYPAPPALTDEAAVSAEAERTTREEECRTLRDFLRRRTALAWEPDGGAWAVPAALSALSRHLGWDPARQAREVKAWEAEAALTQAFRVM